ncbi:MAG: sigma-E processing peptidase SpoIIGA [Clostridia bacterium]|nr:sigma-E processing peptidase SpoIIGA [Clostridia bacterium]
MYQLYLDQMILLQFWMEFLILFCVMKVNKRKTKILRIAFAALFAAVSTSVLYLLPFHYLIKLILIHIAVNGLTLIIAYYPIRKKQITLLVGSLYGITFLFGGALEVLLNHSFFSDHKGEKILRMLIISTSVYIVLLCFLRLYETYHKNRQYIYPAELFYKGRKIIVEGLFDSGNRLYEPISKKPVHLLEEKSAQKLYEGIQEQNYRLIPYSSVGNANGLLFGFEADLLRVDLKNETYESVRPMIAVFEGVMDRKGTYQLILHPNGIEEMINN